MNAESNWDWNGINSEMSQNTSHPSYHQWQQSSQKEVSDKESLNDYYATQYSTYNNGNNTSSNQFINQYGDNSFMQYNSRQEGFTNGSLGGLSHEMIASDPMLQAAKQIGGQFAQQQKERFSKYISTVKLKYYFAVDNAYVGRKLSILLFPFFHKEWSVKYDSSDRAVPPRYDVNAPDLYIPVMAFISYILLCGFVLGIQQRFSPEQLGIITTNAVIYLVIENVIIFITKYLMNISHALTLCHSLAYSTYKYFGMDINLIAFLVGGKLAYYTALSYTSIAIVFFLLRTVKNFVLDIYNNYGDGRKRKIYLLIFISFTQPFIMWWLTRCLCEAGASMNVLNVKGEDAVHVAVDRCNDAEVRDLLAFRADPHTVTAATDVDPECSQSTTSYRPVLSTSKLNTGAAAITKDHYHSVASELDRSSLVSRESTSLLNSNCNNDETYSWTDLLWPQPKNIYPDAEDKNISFPNDSRIKIYFDASSEGDASEMMRIIQLFTSLLSSVGLEVEYRGYKMTEESSSTWNGAVLCGIFESDQLKGSYSLSINECTDIRLFANDYYGFKFGFVTLVQIFRLHRYRTATNYNDITEVRSDNSNERSLSGVSMHHASEYESTLFNESYKSKIPAVPSGVIPCVTIRDNPDSCVRAIFFDFSGCSVLNIDTLSKVVSRAAYCKASHLFLHFEVRTTDRYQLSFTANHIFHLMQLCDHSLIKLVPSLDVQSSGVEWDVAERLISTFMRDFAPSCHSFHFGYNLAQQLITNPTLLHHLHHLSARFFLSLHSTHISSMHTLPAYVTLCIDAVDVIALPSSLYPLNIVIRVNSNQPGYLSNALHSIINTLITANQFAQKLPTSGIMMCNVSTGCEIMPISLAYIPQVASLGIAWNRSIHIPHFSSILPRITAEHFLLNGNMEVLFIQACTLGHVENEVTRLSNGGVESHSKEGSSRTPQMRLSVFVEMLLNPDFMQLQRLTPLIFKKARIQVKARHLKAFVEAQAGTSCDLEVALVLAEVEFVTELMTLICRLGQSLCVHQMKITRVPSTTDINAIAVNDYNEKSCPSNNVNFNYDQFANFHLSNLPVTARTDLANCLLKIRRNFQNIWLSRNMASTLPNALKLFDNLFHALLPADMQSYSDILL